MKTMKMSEIDEARKILNVPNFVKSSEIVRVVAGTGVHQRIKLKLAWRRFAATVCGEVHPTAFPQANGKLTGDAGIDVPICRTDNVVVSCWSVPFWKRLVVFMTGRIWIIAKGTALPPARLATKVYWK